MLDFAAAAWRAAKGGQHGAGADPASAAERAIREQRIMEDYGCVVRKPHVHSVWRRDLHYPERGLTVEVRPMTPDDDQRELDFFQAQTLQERATRFLGIPSNLPPAVLKQLTHINFGVDFAIVGVDRATDGLAGVARYVQLKGKPGHASVAVAVLNRYQRLGLGRYLLGVVFEAAAAHGVTLLNAEILSSNAASKKLFHKVSEDVGARKVFAESDGDVHEYHFHIATPRRAALQAPSAGPAGKLEASTAPRFTVDNSRHPRSLWRHDLVFESGLRLEVRPSDSDDTGRVADFLKAIAKGSGTDAAVSAATAADAVGVGNSPSKGAPVGAASDALFDFVSGFLLVAIDTATDDIVGLGRFQRGPGWSRMHVATLPNFQGLGIADYLSAQLLRAAGTEVIPKMYSAL